MAVGDLWRLVDKQFLTAQTVLNVYFYEEVVSPTTLTPPLALVQAYRDKVITPLLAVQSIALSHVQYSATNLDDPASFGVFDLIEAGGVGSESLPPFVAWAFRLNRATRVVRNGQKRYAGVAESDQVNGEATGAALTRLNAVASALDDPLEQATPDGSWVLRIAHALGTIPETYTPYPVASVSYSRISSQNTRKFGRGA